MDEQHDIPHICLKGCVCDANYLVKCMNGSEMTPFFSDPSLTSREYRIGPIESLIEVSSQQNSRENRLGASGNNIKQSAKVDLDASFEEEDEFTSRGKRMKMSIFDLNKEDETWNNSWERDYVRGFDFSKRIVFQQVDTMCNNANDYEKESREDDDSEISSQMKMKLDVGLERAETSREIRYCDEKKDGTDQSNDVKEFKEDEDGDISTNMKLDVDLEGVDNSYRMEDCDEEECGSDHSYEVKESKEDEDGDMSTNMKLDVDLEGSDTSYKIGEEDGSDHSNEVMESKKDEDGDMSTHMKSDVNLEVADISYKMEDRGVDEGDNIYQIQSNGSIGANIGNVTNNSVVIDDLENLSDNLERIDERIIFENEDDDTSLQTLYDSLEFEYFDILTEVTLAEGLNHNLSEAHKDMIAILVDMTAGKKMTGKDEELGSNRSNSIQIVPCNIKVNTLTLDETVYNHIVGLERGEDIFYQRSRRPNCLQLQNVDSFAHKLYETLQKKLDKEETIFKDESDVTYKLELQSRGSSTKFFHNVFMERLVFSTQVPGGWLNLNEYTVVFLKDFLDFSFNLESRKVISNAFRDGNDVLNVINDLWKTTNEKVVFMDISRTICFDLISAIEYLHRRNLRRLNISTSNIGISADGLIKVSRICPDGSRKLTGSIEEGEKECRDSFSFDYRLLGQVMTEIFIPGLNVFSRECAFVGDGKCVLDIKYNDELRDHLGHIGNDELSGFLRSFYRPYVERCQDFVRRIIIRKYRFDYEENILCLERIKKLRLFSNLDSSSILKSESFSKLMREKLDLVPRLSELID